MTDTSTIAALFGLNRHDDSWKARAACRDVDRDGVFYKGDGGIDDLYEPEPDFSDALAICGDCPVSAQCLKVAIAMRDHQGVAGGKTPREIQALITRGGAPHGTLSRYADGCRCDPCHEVGFEFAPAVDLTPVD